MRIIAMLSCVLAAAVSFTAEAAEKGLVAHYKFSEGQGSVLRDSSAIGNNGKIIGAAWVKGQKGSALDFDGAGECVDCGDDPTGRVAGPLTLSVWFQTIARTQQYVANRGGWNLHLTHEGIPVFESRTHDNSAWDTLSARDPAPLNQWTCVSVVYDTEKKIVEMYVDGKLSASKHREGPVSTKTSDTSLGGIGGLHRSKLYLGKGLAGLMGEFRLYNRALSAAEVQALYVKTAPDPALEPMQYRVSITPRLFFDQQKVNTEVRISSNRRPDTVNALEVELRRSNGRKLIDRRVLSDGDITARNEVTFPLTDLPRGEYELRAVAKDGDGRQLARSSAVFNYPKNPWWYNSSAGMTDKVLAPWTDLQLKDKPSDGAMEVSCLGRKYIFGPGPLLERIVSASQSILAQPVRLTAIVDGVEVDWTPRSTKVEKDSPDTVRFSKSFSGRSLDLGIVATVEYDGLMRFDCEIKPTRNVRLDKLVLEIPLEVKCATLQYQYRDNMYKAPGAVKDGFARSFNPAIWLGNEDVGMQWFTESDENWYPSDPERAIEIVRDGDVTILRLNLVTTPVELAVKPKSSQVDTLGYTFGLLPTPVKTFDKDSWDYRVAGALGYGKEYDMLSAKWKGEPLLDFYERHGVKTIVLFNWTDVLSYPGIIGPHQKQLRDLVDACHKRGMQVILYLGNQVSELAPEFAGFMEEFVQWEGPTPYSYNSYPDNYPPMRAQLVYNNCSGSRWSEFVIAGCERMMDEYDVDGFYLDGVSCPIRCCNVEHGCGYRKPDGSLGISYPIWEARNLIRRLYTLVKSRKPEGQIDLHNASFMMAPSLSWATNRWDGETILGEDRKGYSPKEGDFMLDFLPLDAFRAQFIGKQWGVPAEFLDYYTPYPYERQFAITLLHDVAVRATNPEYVEAAYPLRRAMDQFGRKEAKWLPYWENSAYVTASPDGAYVSLYQHPKNGVLAVVSNLGRESEQVTVNLKLDKLDLPSSVVATDALTGERVAIDNDQMDLDLDSVDWRLIWLRP